MAKPLIYDKTITIRVTYKQHKKYLQYCKENDITLNQLARFVLDKAVSKKDDIVNKIIAREIIRNNE